MKKTTPLFRAFITTYIAFLFCVLSTSANAQTSFRLIVGGGTMRTTLSGSTDVKQIKPWHTATFHMRAICNVGHLQVGVGVFSGGIDKQVLRDTGLIPPTTFAKYQPTSYISYGPQSNSVGIAWPYITPHVIINYRRDITKWMELYAGGIAGIFFARTDIYDKYWTKTRSATWGLNTGVQFKVTRLLSIDISGSWFTTKQKPTYTEPFGKKPFEDYDPYRLKMMPLTAGLSMKF
jgi:hypothetical protein